MSSKPRPAGEKAGEQTGRRGRAGGRSQLPGPPGEKREASLNLSAKRSAVPGPPGEKRECRAVIASVIDSTRPAGATAGGNFRATGYHRMPRHNSPARRDESGRSPAPFVRTAAFPRPAGTKAGVMCLIFGDASIPGPPGQQREASALSKLISGSRSSDVTTLGPPGRKAGDWEKCSAVMVRHNTRPAGAIAGAAEPR